MNIVAKYPGAINNSFKSDLSKSLQIIQLKKGTLADFKGILTIRYGHGLWLKF